ncbi:MAG: hypothetical protein SAJ12_21090 [Jaaginema sp. PMC 1079.18]|nr:hypothetical protein [Jaaginema sp. PMC 1080.18]MEC4853483.1 hypothetical protein [Jaaginema sp. PMC 1079.18]MEC4869017.1 hypothetical protein [Jaaginema sp. PMC 1078.18]
MNINKIALGTLSVLLLSATAGMNTANAEIKETENRTKQARFFDAEMRGQEYDEFEYEEFYNSEDSYSGSRIEDLNNNQRNYDNSNPENSSSGVYYFRNDSQTSQDSFYANPNNDPGAFTLVSLAYRGRYENYGIPGYLNFISSYRSGEVDAEDIVAAGVKTGEIEPMALQDEGFISAVETQVESLILSQ